MAERYYATGRRKRSVARVWLTPGTGKITVNKQPMGDFFRRETLGLVVRQPLEHLGQVEKYDVFATVKGGGWSGQAGAMRLGISRCLVQIDESEKKNLKSQGFLTRDSREVERKKPGQKKARKKFQFSKR